MRPDQMPRDAMREEDFAQQVRDVIRDPINMQADALLAIERLARNGHGLWFSQTSAGASYKHIGIGSTTEEFCAAVIALAQEANNAAPDR